MKVPLEIVKGRNGTLEDIFGRPMVIVFDTKDKNCKKPTDDQNGEVTSNDHQPFLFVDASASSKRDVSLEKSVRSHVRKKQTARKCGKSKPRRRCSVILNEDATRKKVAWQASLPPQPGISFDPFACYPVPMQPHMYELVHNYLTVLVYAWFPKEAGHTEASSQHSLFKLAMSDAALFHAIMCSSSLCLDIAYGRSESSHSIIHKIEAIHLINVHLKVRSAISDATIEAVCFLATIEAILGNHEASDIHKAGLIYMVNLRGGLTDLNFPLQAKVRNLISPAGSDGTCCLDFFHRRRRLSGHY